MHADSVALEHPVQMSLGRELTRPTFWVILRQRVRVLLVRCHSSFTVLSRIRSRSPEDKCHRRMQLHFPANIIFSLHHGSFLKHSSQTIHQRNLMQHMSGHSAKNFPFESTPRTESSAVLYGIVPTFEFHRRLHAVVPNPTANVLVNISTGQHKVVEVQASA